MDALSLRGRKAKASPPPDIALPATTPACAEPQTMASQLLQGALDNELTSTLVLARQHSTIMVESVDEARNLAPDPHRRETGVAVEAARWVAALTGAVLPQAVEDGDKVLDSLHEWLRDGVNMPPRSSARRDAEPAARRKQRQQ